MSSLRTLFGILVLSAIAYGVYASLMRNPQFGDRLESAPAWSGGGTAANQPPQAATGKSNSVAGFQSPSPTAAARPGTPTPPVLNIGPPSGPPPGVATPSAPNGPPTNASGPPGSAAISSFGGPTATLQNPLGSSPPGNAMAMSGGLAPTGPIPGMGAGVPAGNNSPAAAADIAARFATANTPPGAAPASAGPVPGSTLPAAPNAPGGPPGFSSANPAPSGTLINLPPLTMPSANPLSPNVPSAAAAANPAVPNSPPGVSAPPATTPPGAPRGEFQAFMQAVNASLAAGKLSDAQLHLSTFYNRPGLSPAEAEQVTALLDQLAGTVIYSKQHLLEPPYRTLPGDTLQKISQDYGVSAELLGKINGLREGQPLTPGTELKVLRGPFEAVVDLQRYELTMFLKGRYAGRFRIGVGRDYPPPAGAFAVCEKQLNPMFYGPDRTIDAGDPANPLGKRLLNLGQQVAIHGTNNPQGVGRADGRGSIFLSDREIDDVFDILSVGSTVTIRR